ncbi:hypothetical protein [Nocardioides sp.]|uniref:hypothetical protein n=1 Tax=Nocardioides sp. TaxID=35761 RepID=UPI0035270390
MATNFTTLAVVVTALKDVSASGVGMAGVGLALAFVLFFGCLPAWLPIAVATASPRHGRAALREFGTLVTRHGRTIGLSLTAVVGGYLVVRGMVGLG